MAPGVGGANTGVAGDLMDGLCIDGIDGTLLGCDEAEVLTESFRDGLVADTALLGSAECAVFWRLSVTVRATTSLLSA